MTEATLPCKRDLLLVIDTIEKLDALRAAAAGQAQANEFGDTNIWPSDDPPPLDIVWPMLDRLNGFIAEERVALAKGNGALDQRLIDAVVAVAQRQPVRTSDDVPF